MYSPSRRWTNGVLPDGDDAGVGFTFESNGSSQAIFEVVSPNFVFSDTAISCSTSTAVLRVPENSFGGETFGLSLNS